MLHKKKYLEENIVIFRGRYEELIWFIICLIQRLSLYDINAREWKKIQEEIHILLYDINAREWKKIQVRDSFPAFVTGI